MIYRVQTCSLGYRVCHAATGGRDARHGRSQQKDSTLCIGVQRWQSCPKDVEIRFAIDRPALKYKLTAFRKQKSASIPCPTRLH